jgi:parvulin-like peptidyl-prolyl isomerase
VKFPVLILLTAASLLQAEPAAVLGKLGDLELTTDELRETVASLDRGQAATLTQDAAALSQFARALLLQRLVLKQATEKQWDREPAVIAKLVQARETALAESYLAAVSAPAPDYPSETELKEAYIKSKAALRVPKSFQLAQIFLSDDRPVGSPPPPNVPAVSKRLKAKAADFAAIAKASSDDAASAARGGVIGWLTESQIQPEIRAKLPKLTLGAVSEPIRLADGWHILKVLDIREAHTPTFDQIRSQLSARLREERASANRQDFLARLLKDQPLAINEIELSKVSQGTVK